MPLRHKSSRRVALLVNLLGLLLIAQAVATVVAPAASAALVLTSRPETSWRVNGTVYAETVVGNRLVVGGSFTAAISPSGEQVARSNLAEFSMLDGSLVTSFRADTDDRVRALISDGTRLWVGGSFREVNGVTRAYIAKVLVSTGAVYSDFDPKPNSSVRALARWGSRLYLGGTFTSIGPNDRSRVGAVDATNGAISRWAAQANGDVYALALNPVSGRVYVGGDFTTVDGLSRTAMAEVGTSGSVVSTRYTGATQPVRALAVSAGGSAVYGGMGSIVNAVFSWSTSTGARNFRVTTDGDIQALIYYDGVLYAGFHDGYMGDASIKVLALNRDTGAVGSWRPSFDDFYGVYALAASSAGLAVGGDFTQISGVAAQGFSRFVNG